MDRILQERLIQIVDAELELEERIFVWISNKKLSKLWKTKVKDKWKISIFQMFMEE